MLEAIVHGEKNCSFVTLTYSDNNNRGEVDPRDLQLWLKRLRRRLHPRAVRFFAVAEYGDTTQRPHYHAAVFGLGPCSGGLVGSTGCGCPSCSVVRETWGLGHVLVARLQLQSAQYIARYTLKKMTQASDPRLRGRHPEFARMSLRPGIGADALHDVASVMMQYRLEKRGDVPLSLMFGGKHLPLGRYLRGKLRELVGLPPGAPPAALREAFEKLSLVRRFAFENDRSVASVFEELNAPYEASLAAREKVSSERRHNETL